MATLLDIARRGRASALGYCAVCRQPVTERGQAMRLHGLWVHRACASYRVRYLDRRGVRPGTPRAPR